jgi:hypothetical protein
VYDGQVPVVPDWLERSERRVQAEETIQVDGGVFALVRFCEGRGTAMVGRIS